MGAVCGVASYYSGAVWVAGARWGTRPQNLGKQPAKRQGRVSVYPTAISGAAAVA
jgi:hypothetical protein